MSTQALNDNHVTVLNEIGDILHNHNVNKGWHERQHTDADVGLKIALIHSEISEALEGYRKDLMDDHLPLRKAFEVELADAMIRIFDLAGLMKFDLGGALVEKAHYNDVRPDHKLENRKKEHGKRF